VRKVATNARIVLQQKDAVAANGAAAPGAPSATLLTDVTAQIGFGFTHRENDFVDFDRERLIPKLISTEGPAVAVADVNGDGLDDVFVGGAKDQVSQLMLQRPDGRFARSNPGLFEPDSISEDVGAIFFDANGDKRPDLYVVSGGTEYSDFASALQDRLYLNDGNGRFHKTDGFLPSEANSGSRVAAADFDGNGSIDLFIGGRALPGRYGRDPESVLLRNDGTGHFTDVTATLAPAVAHVGMVTDALWRDITGDGRPELVVVGDWMPLTIFRNMGGGKLEPMPSTGLAESGGWWNRVIAGDFAGNGRVDFLVGNAGLNQRLRASRTEPTTMFVKDFDGNGFDEQIVTTVAGGKRYPIVLRDDLIKAIPPLKARYRNYKDYATQTITDIFPAADLSTAVARQVHTFETALARNNGDGTFTLVPLPREAQLAPIFGMLASDFTGDGKLDLLTAGNFTGLKPELGGMDANYGLLLTGDGKGGFAPMRASASGFRVPGEVRDIQRLRTRQGELLMIVRNNDTPMFFRARASTSSNSSRPNQ
jgi:enediyne biosynthesis protein E4